jgi:hypothetical protein
VSQSQTTMLIGDYPRAITLIDDRPPLMRGLVCGVILSAAMWTLVLYLALALG